MTPPSVLLGEKVTEEQRIKDMTFDSQESTQYVMRWWAYFFYLGMFIAVRGVSEAYKTGDTGRALLAAVMATLLIAPVGMLLAILAFKYAKGRYPDLPEWVYMGWLRRA